jgi:hypothetical protein
MPQATKPADYTLQIKMLRECQTIEDLQTVYGSLTTEQKTATVNVKDEMKLKLTK